VIRQGGERNDKEYEKGILSILISNQVIFVLAFAFICQVGLSFYGGFTSVYLLNLGYGQGTIGLLNCISALSEVPVLFFANKLLKKLGSMKLLIASCIMMGIRTIMVTGGTLPIILLSQTLQGVTYMTVYYSCVIYINKNVKWGKQSQGQSILAIIQAGIGSILGNILGGYLADYAGLRISYFIMAIFIFTSTILVTIIMMVYTKKEKYKES
jgi:MFS family permease